MDILHADARFAQRFLKSAGWYGGDIDGLRGPKTRAAEQAFLEQVAGIASTTRTFDAATERHIATLLPRAQRLARTSLMLIRDAGIDARIISGTRTYVEQDALYAQGRTRPGKRVTNARGGQSNHNFGLAWDIGIFRTGQYVTDPEEYERAAASGIIEGVEWGGAWRTFKDRPHYQVATGLSVSQIRRKFERGALVL